MKSCWDCSYQDLAKENVFLGYCTWFIDQGEKPKEIPPNVVNVGCQHHDKKTEDDIHAAKIDEALIDVFDGEVEYVIPRKKQKYYNRKAYKTKHKYTKRKDW